MPKQPRAAAPTLTITLRLLREWQACSDGRQWFETKFPQGGTYPAVQQALRDDRRFADSRWLTNAVFRSLLKDPVGVMAAVDEDTAAEIKSVQDATKVETTLVVVDSSGTDTLNDGGKRDARIGSSGYGARIGSSGDDARIGSSGYGARIGSSGDDARIGSSGDDARIGSSGYGARIGSSGYGARITATGEKAVIACAGQGSKAKAGPGGAIALTWFDEAAGRPRISVAYVGENDIKADTWYALDDSGAFVEVSE